jgi:hypothetical protein
MKDGKWWNRGRKRLMFTRSHHAYTDLLLFGPQMDPDWLSDLLKERASTILVMLPLTTCDQIGVE